MPFGEEIGAGIGSRTAQQGYSQADGLRQKFTSKERDIESGLDFFEARYYSSPQGRFTSTDPSYFQVSMAIDPQRFNLYGYARNNPLKWVDPNGDKLFLRGDTAWLQTNVLYDMAGGQAEFDKYFEIVNGEVVLKSGVNTSSVNAGVQLVLDLVNSSDNYLYYAGIDGQDAAAIFQGSFETDKKGNLKITDAGKKRAARFNGTVSNEQNAEGTLVGTNGRGGGTLQPASLANGDPVFCVIAYNTKTVQIQAGLSKDFPILMRTQLEGVAREVKPVSFFIHESAENLVFAQQGGTFDYRGAHTAAMRREATIRKELKITGGFAGGGVIQSNVVK